MTLIAKSLIIGCLTAVTAFSISYTAWGLNMSGLAHVLYWQGWWLQTLIPCLNIGTIETLICEGTLLNLALFVLGLPFGAVLYSLVTWFALRAWMRSVT